MYEVPFKLGRCLRRLLYRNYTARQLIRFGTELVSHILSPASNQDVIEPSSATADEISP